MKYLLWPFQLIYTILFWVMCATIFIMHFCVAVIICRFSSNPAALNQRLTVPFLKTGFFLFGIRVTINGLEKINKDQTNIIISNHESYLDILSYLIVWPVKFSFFAKEELLNVPILGWDIKQQGHFVVKRDQIKRAKQQLDDLSNFVQAGNSVLIFPEGTRTPNKVTPFKRGAFVMATQSKAALLHCYITGSGNCLSPTRFLMKPGRITITVGKYLDPATVNDSKALTKLSQETLMEMNPFL